MKDRIIHSAWERFPGLASWLVRANPRGRRQRVLNPFPTNVAQTSSARRINQLSRALPNANRYLEVGVHRGKTFEGVRLPERVAVDPYPLFNLRRLPNGVVVNRQSSDRFFADLGTNTAFSLIFLDGLHQWFQTYKDVLNAFAHLESGGLILMDDVVPCDAVSAMPSLYDSYRVRELMESPERRWHGDVFKCLFALRDHHPNIQFQVIVEDGDDAQAVLWSTDSGDHQRFLPVAHVNEYDWLTYELAFGQGAATDLFDFGAEAQVIKNATDAARLCAVPQRE